jgi:hypothetical protein
VPAYEREYKGKPQKSKGRVEMVKFDRGFLGVLLIAVVISTIVMGFVTVEKFDLGIEIIKNKYPLSIKTSEQSRQTFVLNVIARKAYQRVRIKFGVLRRMDPPFMDPNVTERPDVSLHYLASQITPIRTCLSISKASPVGFQNETLEVDVNGTEYTGLFYDFGQIISAGQENLDLSSAPTCYLLWRDGDGNLTYYQGSSDFFLNRNESLESLTISYNDEETNYRSSKDPAGGDIPTVAEAPSVGIVTYDEVKKDDRMYVMFAVNSLSVPEHKGIVQVIRVYGNGELVDYVTNFISAG